MGHRRAFGEAEMVALRLQQSQGRCMPEPHHSSRRDHRGAGTLKQIRKA
jgi:hypothetical protein